ncbi:MULTISPECIES: hypothetical protein [Leptospira]|uniref:Lipoprotein n=1 Tax=Leptospira paudalimensis TaxID=2950024 RepID=A0ABT3M3K7_9LEPT|nr:MULTISPECIES: hypothetical protein [Leptospira]MCW7502963.1 hypothetical protein [Leptospira paudalimensis]
MKTLLPQFAFILLSFWMVLSCKPSYTKQLDKILEEGTIYQSAIFCEQNKIHLKERELVCIEVTKKAKEEIDSIINRRLDLGIAPVIIEKSKGKEIEEFLKVHTQMGIRYWEIWKSSVILE